MNQRTLLIIAIVLVLAVIACLACVTLGGLGALFYLSSPDSGEILDPFSSDAVESGPTPEVLQTGDLPSDETLRVLEDTIVPDNNPVEMADRFLGIENIPDSLPAPTRPYTIGDRRSFWVTNTDNDESFQTEATLRYAGDTVYFWVENGVDFDQSDLDELASTFEDQMVPIDREFFGSEWNPGIDNDPHIYILYTTNVGFSTAGYFSSNDSVHPDAIDFSNGVEMFVLNADNSPLDDEYTYGVLAHEFQHMIHWYRDRNETSWLNEGLSELATLLNGYYHGGFIQEYIWNPDLQLNDWPNDPNGTTPHYGAGFLFTTYFLERFGEETSKALVADTANGLDSVDNVLEGVNDPLTGRAIKGDDVVLDWVIANYLGDESVSDGRFAYPEYPQVFTQASATENISNCTPDAVTRDVHQYGVDYVNISCEGEYTLRFEGSTQTDLLPADPYSGTYAFWSNKGDESDMTLTQAFDLTGVDGPIEMTYQTWYDIEEDWDYVYVLASTNAGDDWEFLTTPSGTSTDPTGNSFGFGYTGLSGGNGEWIEESVDLSAYAGQEILLRFEYVTDAAVNGEGFLVDDIAIEALGYFSDFEDGAGGWEAAGFARVENVLPQIFRLALISHGDETTVQYLDVPANNVLDIPISVGGDVDEVTLVVMGATRYTRQTAAYRFSFPQ
jgi:immune inhibitor A